MQETQKFKDLDSKTEQVIVENEKLASLIEEKNDYITDMENQLQEYRDCLDSLDSKIQGLVEENMKLN